MNDYSSTCTVLWDKFVRNLGPKTGAEVLARVVDYWRQIQESRGVKRGHRPPSAPNGTDPTTQPIREGADHTNKELLTYLRDEKTDPSTRNSEPTRSIAIARRKPRPPQPTIKSCVDAFKDLEAMGLIKKNGKFRPDRNGVLQPVYVHIQLVPDEELTPAERLIKLASKEGRFQIPEDTETSQ